MEPEALDILVFQLHGGRHHSCRVDAGEKAHKRPLCFKNGGALRVLASGLSLFLFDRNKIELGGSFLEDRAFTISGRSAGMSHTAGYKEV